VLTVGLVSILYLMLVLSALVLILILILLSLVLAAPLPRLPATHQCSGIPGHSANDLSIRGLLEAASSRGLSENRTVVGTLSLGNIPGGHGAVLSPGTKFSGIPLGVISSLAVLVR